MALRVQQMLDDPDCAIDDLGKLIAAEPVLCARVIGIANSIAYNPGGRSITGLKSAISRLGFAALRALAAAVVVRQMKDTPRTKEDRALAEKLWEHTASVASLARIIAKRVTHQNPDAAFFCRHRARDWQLLPDFPRPAPFRASSAAISSPGMRKARPASGRAVLRALKVPGHILDAVEGLWSGYLALPPCSLGDTLLLADEMSPVESPLDALAGMGRKGMQAELEVAINDETLTGILAESAEEMASLSSALRS